jgi:ABC-type dipeptide/oligopeptide/nickel transport system ATPase component
MSHKVVVMYLGKIVETGLTDRIENKSRHPYTNILWSSLVEKHSRESKNTAQKYVVFACDVSSKISSISQPKCQNRWAYIVLDILKRARFISASLITLRSL